MWNRIFVTAARREAQAGRLQVQTQHRQLSDLSKILSQNKNKNKSIAKYDSTAQQHWI